MLRIENGAGLARRRGTTCFLPAWRTIPSTSGISIRRTRHVLRNRLVDDCLDTRMAWANIAFPNPAPRAFCRAPNLSEDNHVE